MAYRVCPDCGAHRDPGEKCDCQEADELEAFLDELEGYLREGDGCD